jgi:hypothetical protein
MAVRPEPSPEPVPSVDQPPVAATYHEGIVAGLIGAGAVALWFLVLDTLAGRPLYTPTVLGTALFRRGAGLDSPETLPVSLEMVGMFTWVHALVFVVMGGIAARLLAVAERNPSLGFGVLLLFIAFQAGFMVVTMLFASWVPQALGWPAIFAANLLAAAGMAWYLRSRHRHLIVEP